MEDASLLEYGIFCWVQHSKFSLKLSEKPVKEL